MKKNYLLSILLFWGAFAGHAQNNYSFSFSNESYQTLGNAFRLNSPDTLLDRYYFTINDSFPVFGAYSNFTTRLPGGIFMTRYGTINSVETPQISYANVYYPFLSTFRRIDTSTAFLVDTGKAGNRIIKLEWKHIGFEGTPNNYYVNFQLWLNKITGQISYHYGPSSLGATDSIGAAIGISRAHTSNLDNYTHASFLGGNPNIQSSLTLQHPATYSAVPLVYTFPPAGTSIYLNWGPTGNPQLSSNTTHTSIYPNPFQHHLFLRCKGSFTWTLHDLSGKELMKGAGQETSMVESNNLPAGVYMVKLNSTNGTFCNKIVKTE